MSDSTALDKHGHPQSDNGVGAAALPGGSPVGSAEPIATDSPGVLLYPEAFESIVEMIRRAIKSMAADESFTSLAIPPVISRRIIERAGYVASFPQLLGTVHSYTGSPKHWAALSPLIADGGDWHAEQQISDLVLLPAACYPVYARLAGQALAAPAKFLVAGNCFRQEATSETGRLRTFRMVELVTAAGEEHCLAWRASRLERVAEWLESLALKVSIEEADDPFFGPAKKLYQAAQRAQELKFELRVPVDGDLVQAVASANYHKDHFGEAFGFTCDDAPGQTACTAFGIERIALALINAHGPSPEGWPASVAAALS